MFGQKVASDEDRHAACNLAHWFQQREAVVDFDCFIRQASYARFYKSLGQRAVGRQMQIREEDLARAQQCTFDRLRLLYFHDQLALLENRAVLGHDSCARSFIIAVGKARASPSIVFNEHAMTRSEE